MKKLFALFLAFIMACTCLTAFAKDDTMILDDLNTADLLFALIPHQMTETDSITADQDAFMQLLSLAGLVEEDMPKESKSVFDAVFHIINTLNVSASYDLDAKKAQLAYSLGEIPLATLSVAADDQQITLLSNLLPTYAVTVNLETLEALTAMVTMQLQPYLEMIQSEIEQAMPALEAALPHLVDAVIYDLEYPQEFEAVEIEKDGILYSQRVTSDFPMNAYLQQAFDAIYAIMTDETVTAYLRDRFDLTLDEEILDSFNSFKQQTLEQYAEVTRHDTVLFTEEMDTIDLTSSIEINDRVMYEYMTANGFINSTTIGIGDAGQDIETIAENAMNGGNALWMQFTQAYADSHLDIYYAGLYAGLEEIQNFTVDSTYDVVVSFYLLNPDAPILTALSSTTMEANFVEGSFDTEGKTILSVEELMSNPDALNLLVEDLSTNGFAVLLGAFATALPNDFMTLFSLLTAAL